MSATDRLAAYAGVNVVDFYHRERPAFIRDVRSLGSIGMLELCQPAGSYPDPDSNNYVMLVPLAMDCHIRFDFGAGAFEQQFMSELSLAPPGTVCDYEVDGTHHFLGLSIPADPVAELLRDLDPRFPGDFGPLHARLWRSTEIRELALRIWRAGKGDAAAPALDPDTALMTLALLLMARAGRGPETREFRYRLSPHLRRRVLDHIEGNLHEDLSLFRLAAVAGLSPFHFARAFRDDLGDTPHRYVLRRRLDAAREMIRGTDLPLAQIALACGFSSQSRLTQVFVRDMGISPGGLRRSARN